MSDAPRRSAANTARRSISPSRRTAGPAVDPTKPGHGRATSAGRATPGARPQRRKPTGRSAPPAAERSGGARRRSSRGGRSGTSAAALDSSTQLGFGTATRKVMSGLLQMPFNKSGASDGDRGFDGDSDDFDAQVPYAWFADAS